MTVALLTPVPLIHLKSAHDRGGPAVFGTRALDVLQKVDELSQHELTVLLYASHSEGSVRSLVTWTAHYVGWEAAVGNGLPPRAWRRLRPGSTSSEDREAGWWYAFYRVDDLQELDGPIQIGSLRSAKDGRRLSELFIPEGPVLVER